MKSPSFVFYVKDHFTDTARLSLKARGAWITILCQLYLAENRGKMTAGIDEWATILGANKIETESALKEIGDKKVADVTFRNADCNADVTVVCRRMVREEKARWHARKRQERFRGEHEENDSNAEVTQDVTQKFALPAVATTAFATTATTATAQKKTTTPPPKGGGDDPLTLVNSCKPNEEPFPLNLQTPTFVSTWADWLTFRKQLHKPLTSISRKKQLAMLAEAGPETAIKIVNQSIQNNWQGLFSLQEKTHARSATARRDSSELPYARADEPLPKA